MSLIIEDLELEMRLARLEYLMDRRPLLINRVLLRQNPHNVQEWLKRVKLYEDKPKQVKLENICEAWDRIVKELNIFWKLWKHKYIVLFYQNLALIFPGKGIQYLYRYNKNFALLLWCCLHSDKILSKQFCFIEMTLFYALSTLCQK